MTIPSLHLALNVAMFTTELGLCTHQEEPKLLFFAKEEGQLQSSRFVPLLEQLLLQAGKSYRDIQQISVTTGPGSFTGIRLGLAAVTALAMASENNIKIAGISCFDVLHEAARQEAASLPILTVIDGKRAELYWQWQEGDTILTGCDTAVDLYQHWHKTPLCITGNAPFILQQQEELLSSLWKIYPQPQLSLRYLAKRGYQQPLPAGEYPIPLYARNADVTMPR
ncbi:MAG: tRNA (adenosine(37)-N6)-threonylcarbamoyltransferase complex dimerization subunit type 1 TsaB [Alphaproteobacteria bacterium]